MRPNAPTMEAIRALRMDTSLQQVYYQTKLQEEEVMPYPLPPGTVSMHVRSQFPALMAGAAPYLRDIRPEPCVSACRLVGMAQIAYDLTMACNRQLRTSVQLPGTCCCSGDSQLPRQCAAAHLQTRWAALHGMSSTLTCSAETCS